MVAKPERNDRKGEKAAESDESIRQPAEKPVSLHPMDFNQALKALLQTRKEGDTDG